MNPQPKQNKNHVKLKPAAYRKLKWDVAERDEFTCQICGNMNRDELELMHKIHKGVGGRNGPGDTMENTFCGCIGCHMQEENYRNGMKKK